MQEPCQRERWDALVMDDGHERTEWLWWVDPPPRTIALVKHDECQVVPNPIGSGNEKDDPRKDHPTGSGRIDAVYFDTLFMSEDCLEAVSGIERNIPAGGFIVLESGGMPGSRAEKRGLSSGERGREIKVGDVVGQYRRERRYSEHGRIYLYPRSGTIISSDRLSLVLRHVRSEGIARLTTRMAAYIFALGAGVGLSSRLWPYQFMMLKKQ